MEFIAQPNNYQNYKLFKLGLVLLQGKKLAKLINQDYEMTKQVVTIYRRLLTCFSKLNINNLLVKFKWFFAKKNESTPNH